MSYGADAPLAWENIPVEERAKSGTLEDEWCIIEDGEDRHFFVRGCLEIPVKGSEDPFVWIVWVSLSKKNFDRTMDLWEKEGREAEPPYFGWFLTALPGYPDTRLLETSVRTRKVGQRPLIELHESDHPLFTEQQDGISMERVKAIAVEVLHQE